MRSRLAGYRFAFQRTGKCRNMKTLTFFGEKYLLESRWLLLIFVVDETQNFLKFFDVELPDVIGLDQPCFLVYLSLSDSLRP